MSDNESDASFPEVLTREQMTEFESNDVLSRQNVMERNPYDQRFNDRQIGEITDLVLALTQQISSNPREGNGLHVVTTSTNGRSDTFLFIGSIFKRSIFLVG